MANTDFYSLPTAPHFKYCVYYLVLEFYIELKQFNQQNIGIYTTAMEINPKGLILRSWPKNEKRCSYFSECKLFLNFLLLATTPFFMSCSSLWGVRVSNAASDEIIVKAYFKSASDEDSHEVKIQNSKNDIPFISVLAAVIFDNREHEKKSKNH